MEISYLKDGKMEISYLKNPLGCPLGRLAKQPALTWAKEKVTQKTQLSWQCSLKYDNHETIWCEMNFWV